MRERLQLFGEGADAVDSFFFHSVSFGQMWRADKARVPCESRLERGADCAASFELHEIARTAPMTGRHVFYEGHVQGVGFRFTVKQVARGYEVVGWVRNLDDGRVEMHCSGETGEVEAFLEAIAESELKRNIKRVTASTIPPLAGARGFEIVH